MDIIGKSLEIASQAHEHQYRKQSKIPYITHPVAVGMILMKEGYDEEIIAAGILHDTVEDTGLSLEEIEMLFGQRIAQIVKGCSEPDKSLPWEERKKHTIEFLKTASFEIRVVACADKLHNIRSIINDYEKCGDEVWSRFNKGKQHQEWYYRNIVNSIGYMSTFRLHKELASAVDDLFTKTNEKNKGES